MRKNIKNNVQKRKSCSVLLVQAHMNDFFKNWFKKKEKVSKKNFLNDPFVFLHMIVVIIAANPIVFAHDFCCVYRFCTRFLLCLILKKYIITH